MACWWRGTGGGAQKKGGEKVYRRQEKRGQEVGFPRWWEAGEIEGNYATLCNIFN